MVDQDSENDISTGYDEGIDVEDTRGKKEYNWDWNICLSFD